ncbi:hypothetical protein FB45DRAFT_277370 [Roridomyces roridus]|uniref:Secreted protein n=1 Tax=Roridomyces roridus TaxID=1738132 RepID=A0AAD7C9V2_9AGAR|nr:hypothetical protein FB45DRAFT_277370 [Roridomyces roridus]
MAIHRLSVIVTALLVFVERLRPPRPMSRALRVYPPDTRTTLMRAPRSHSARHSPSTYIWDEVALSARRVVSWLAGATPCGTAQVVGRQLVVYSLSRHRGRASFHRNVAQLSDLLDPSSLAVSPCRSPCAPGFIPLPSSPCSSAGLGFGPSRWCVCVLDRFPE